MVLYREMGVLDVRATLTNMVLEANEYFLIKGFKAANGTRIRPWNIRLNETLGINPNYNPSQQTNTNNNISLTRKRTALTAPLGPQQKKRRLNNALPSTSFQFNPPTTPQTPTNPQSITDVIQQRAQHASNQFDQQLLQQPQSLEYIQHRQMPQLPQQPINPTTHYAQTIPNPPPQQYFQHQKHISNADQMNRMINQFSNTVQRPGDPLKKNPYIEQLDEDINNASRDLSALLKNQGYAVTIVKKEVVVERICKIAEGPILDSKMRNLCKMLNTSTNKEVADELQGTRQYPTFNHPFL